MTATVTYPSTDFPAPPAVSVPVLDGWEPLAAVEPLVTVVKVPHVDGEFQPNVVITNKRTVGVSLERAADAVKESLESSEQWAERGQGYAPALGGRECFHIEGAFIVEGVGTVVQTAVITIVEQGPYTDIVQVVGTCTASQIHDAYSDIRLIVLGASLPG